MSLTTVFEILVPEVFDRNREPLLLSLHAAFSAQISLVFAAGSLQCGHAMADRGDKKYEIRLHAVVQNVDAKWVGDSGRLLGS